MSNEKLQSVAILAIENELPVKISKITVGVEKNKENHEKITAFNLLHSVHSKKSLFYCIP